MMSTSVFHKRHPVGVICYPRVGSGRAEHLEILTAMAGILQHLEQLQLLQLARLSYIILCFH